jgi:phage terminase large subunit GpA-like protein
MPASAHLAMSDREPMQTSVNTSLGQAWQVNLDYASEKPVLERRENYAADTSPHPILVFNGGGDVQDDRFEIEVVGWRRDTRKDPEESWGVVDGVIYGDLGRARLGSIWMNGSSASSSPRMAGGSASARCASTRAATTRKRSIVFVT